MKYLFTTIAALAFVACTNEPTAPTGQAKSSECPTCPATCDFHVYLDSVATTTSCDDLEKLIGECSTVWTAEELAEITAAAHAHSVANAFDPCVFSWE